MTYDPKKLADEYERCGYIDTTDEKEIELIVKALRAYETPSS
jgi:hypothetical protein